MSSVKSYRELTVWQRSMKLTRDTYGATRQWPKEETYGLTSQIRRAAISVPANIAEGQARLGTKEFIQFLGIARGSLAEVETLLLLSNELSYTTPDDVESLLSNCTEIGRLLNGLLRSLSVPSPEGLTTVHYPRGGPQCMNHPRFTRVDGAKDGKLYLRRALVRGKVEKDMSSIILDIPGDVLLALKVPPEQAGAALRMAAAIKLFELGQLSSGAAARLAGVPRVIFLSRLADYGVDTFHLSEEELQRETRLA